MGYGNEERLIGVREMDVEGLRVGIQHNCTLEQG